MRAHEIFEHVQYLYLGSHIPLGGEVSRVDLKAEGHPRHHTIEILLEKARPSVCLSRSACVFLAEHATEVSLLGMPIKHVYRVTPVGPVQRSDLGWWRLIRDSLAQPVLERPQTDDWAEQYWAGNQCTVGRSVWEVRTEAALVV